MHAQIRRNHRAMKLPICFEGDPLEVLVLANQYGEKRLMNLCELYIAKILTKDIGRSEGDVISLLQMAQVWYIMMKTGI